MNIEVIKDGIMNYVRQISQGDRVSQGNNLKPTFDFETWLTVVESSIEQTKSNPSTQLAANGVSVDARGNDWSSMNEKDLIGFNQVSGNMAYQETWDTWAYEEWCSPVFTG
jgi:hypothetical protein